MNEFGREPAEVIDEVQLAWEPGYFETGRDLARAAMYVVGRAPYIDSSLESLADDLIEHDDRVSE